MPKVLLTIRSKGEGYTSDVIDHEDGRYSFLGDLDVDIDGSPNWHRDPDGQPTTSLKLNGKNINSDAVPGIVLPTEIIKAVEGIVLGCKASVAFRGKVSDAVVFDVGPHKKPGEGSPELARRLGIDPDPNR